MVTTPYVLIVLSPIVVTLGVLAYADEIVAWWDKRHPELRPPTRGASDVECIADRLDS